MAFALFAAACTIAAVVYVSLAARRVSPPNAPGREPLAAPSAAPAQDTVSSRLAELRRDAHLYYRSARTGEVGQIVVASLSDPEGQRWVSPLHCDRAHFSRDLGVCVQGRTSGLGGQVDVQLIDGELRTRQRFEFDGFPSRARVASDGRFASVTLFVSGDDYEADFSTRTKIFDVAANRLLPDIEFFDVERDGQPFASVDFNYWGVTFVEGSSHAYATLGTGGKTHLVRTDIAARQVQTLREDAECPSLSPSGKRLAYKQRAGAAGTWRLHVLELDSLTSRPVSGEARSVDDQVEWLDEQRIVYGVYRDPERQELGADLWMSPIDGQAEETARLWLPLASSPAIIRHRATMPSAMSTRSQ